MTSEEPAIMWLMVYRNALFLS